MKISNILEDEGIYEYLSKRNIIKQYKKAKNNIIQNINSKTYFKERNSKGSNIWYFRINNKYRAFGTIDNDNDLIIFKIDNHQN